MLQKEFFERTGINLTEQEFNQVHAIYMQAGDNVDKDQFCADWKKHHDSNLLRYYKRIAIVEADSLAVLRVIYPVKEEE